MATRAEAALLTDLYQLTMLQAYLDQGMEDTAVFEFFVRKLPEERNFLMAAGLEQVLDYLEELRVSQEELDWLAGDNLTLEGDAQTGTPLLATVMRGGRRVAPSPTLVQAREHAAAQLATLPEPLRGLDKAAAYPVTVSASLRELARRGRRPRGLSTGHAAHPRAPGAHPLGRGLCPRPLRHRMTSAPRAGLRPARPPEGVPETLGAARRVS